MNHTCVITLILLALTYLHQTSAMLVRRHHTTRTVEWCNTFIKKPGTPGHAIRACRRNPKMFRAFKSLKHGKQSVYMKKLWKALADISDEPGSQSRRAHGWLPHVVNMTTNTVYFRRCFQGQAGNRMGLVEGVLSKIELVVPLFIPWRNSYDDIPGFEERPPVTVIVNGVRLPPSEAIVVVDGTVTFDMTFVAPTDFHQWCQWVNVVLEPEVGVEIDPSKIFFYEFYNMDDRIQTSMRHLTRHLSLKKGGRLQSYDDSSIPQSRSKRDFDSSRCRVHPLWLHFNEDLGMRFVLQPQMVNIGRCAGLCSRSPDIFASSEFTTGHAVLLNNYPSTSKCNASALLSCVPDTMSSIPISYLLNHETTILKIIPAVTIRSCRCS